MANLSIPEFLSAERSLPIFLFASVFLGGGAALLAGRAIASAWRPRWHVVPFMLILGLAVRFLHFAVFGTAFLSLHYYFVDTIVCLASGLSSFRLTRVRQMVTRYAWINEGAGPFGWRSRS
jgi:Domain of unknown function (DUF6867)